MNNLDIVKMQESILKAINSIVSEKLKTLQFDYTISGKIISDDTGGLYTVEINSENSQIKSINGNTYLPNDIVLIHVNRNNFSDKFILCKKP